MPDGQQNTIAHYAVMARQLVLNDLSQANTDDLIAQNKFGQTPLHLAVIYSRRFTRGFLNVSAAEILLAIYAEKLTRDQIIKVLQVQDENGDTSLHLALRQKQFPDIMKVLTEKFLEYKIHPDIVNKKGWTPLYVFVDRYHKDDPDAVIALSTLLKAGANCDYLLSEDIESNTEKNTPLKLAAAFNCAWMMFSMQSNIEMPTPAHFVKKYGFTREKWELQLQNVMWNWKGEADKKLEAAPKILEIKDTPAESSIIAPRQFVPMRFHLFAPELPAKVSTDASVKAFPLSSRACSLSSRACSLSSRAPRGTS